MLEPALSRFARFRDGLAAPVEGFIWLNRHPALWRYAALPILLNLLITLAVLIAAIAAVIWFGGRISSYYEGRWLGEALKWLAYVALFVLAAGVALAVWMLLQGILVGYFNGILARHVEIELGMRPDDIRELSILYQIFDAMGDLFILLCINVGLLMLHIIPVVGSIIAIPLTIYFDARVFGDDLFDYPLDLRGMRRDAKAAVLRAHRWESVGLGTSCFLFMFIPVVGSIGLTAGTVGAVLMHRRWE